jgi:ADP-L-glycero-D-manno-heptose 6-epimerase
MKILVTGWNGRNRRSFIPAQVATYLKSKGHEVDGWMWDENYEKDGISGWTYHPRKKQYLHQPYTSHEFYSPITKYDLIIHLGAISSTTEKDVEVVMKQNYDFTLWLINQCQYHKIPLQYASSASVYGNTKHFIEEGKCDPKTPYAWSKYLIDRIVQKHGSNFTSPVVGFRYFNVYGGYEQHKGSQASIFQKLEDCYYSGETFNIFEGSENYKRDFVFVGDIGKVHEQMIGSDFTGILNVGTGTARSFSDIVNTFQEYGDVHVEEIEMPKELKSHYQEYTCADLTELNKHVNIEWTSVEDYFDQLFGKTL